MPPQRNSLRLLYVLDTLSGEAGGPARSVPGLAEAILAQGVELTLLCGPSPNAVAVSPALKKRVRQLTRVPGFLPLAGLGEARRAYTAWRDASVEPGTRPVVHVQHLWTPLIHHFARWAHRDGIPYLVSPRGMLASFALRQKGWKKRLALWLYQRRDLRRAAAVHATAPKEVDEARRLLRGHAPPVVVVPNGVAPPASLDDELDGDATRMHLRDTNAPRTALFLSRIHPQKGLADVLAAWQRLRPPGWRLLVVGSDELGKLAEYQAYVSTHGLSDTVRFYGAVDDAEKWRLYRQADLFVLPTHGENFGLVIAEALAAGVPVITTQEAPWAAIREHNLGWWIPREEAALDEALREATRASDAERHAMGQRGRQYIRDHFEWPSIAEQMLGIYLRLASGSPVERNG